MLIPQGVMMHIGFSVPATALRHSFFVEYCLLLLVLPTGCRRRKTTQKSVIYFHWNELYAVCCTVFSHCCWCCRHFQKSSFLYPTTPNSWFSAYPEDVLPSTCVWCVYVLILPSWARYEIPWTQAIHRYVPLASSIKAQNITGTKQSRNVRRYT